MIRVLIVDDHKVLTESLRFLLNQSNEIEVAGISPRSEDALPMYRELKPDVVLMDIHFYDEKRQNLLMDGIEGLKQIKEYDPKAKVLILTSETSGKYLEKAKTLIDGYVIKDCSIEELIEAIKSCHKGWKIFDPLTFTQVMKGNGNGNGNGNAKQVPGEKTPAYDLSDKEMRVINLVAEGKTCKEIAAEFNLAEGYIRNMLIGIYNKLGIESHKSPALVAFAAKMGWLG